MTCVVPEKGCCAVLCYAAIYLPIDQCHWRCDRWQQQLRRCKAFGRVASTCATGLCTAYVLHAERNHLGQSVRPQSASAALGSKGGNQPPRTATTCLAPHVHRLTIHTPPHTTPPFPTNNQHQLHIFIALQCLNHLNGCGNMRAPCGWVGGDVAAKPCRRGSPALQLYLPHRTARKLNLHTNAQHTSDARASRHVVHKGCVQDQAKKRQQSKRPGA
jgi:hypothetical protein